MEIEKPDDGEWRAVTTEMAGEMAEAAGAELDPFEAGAIAWFLNKEVIDRLKEGWIPALAKIDEDGENAEVQVTLTKDQLKAVWRILTKMSEEEMDARIKSSGFYNDSGE